MTTFFTKLATRVNQANSLLCIGLDPQTPDAATAQAECLRLISATAPFAAAFKPNSAFFEAHGAAGWQALAEVIAAVPADIPVILDAKRGDIGNTAAAYAEAAFGKLDADALTVNPYLGSESLAPFFTYAEKAVFVLCRTSNPGAASLQELAVNDDIPFYLHVAAQALDWAETAIPSAEIGLVVGATQPDALAAVREIAPDTWLLLPGVGAQGADLGAALQAGLRADGSGVLVACSRQIAQATDPAQAARDLQNAINAERAARLLQPAAELEPEACQHVPITAVAEALRQAGCIRFGEFTLKSGKISPVYIDMRRLVSFPAQLSVIANACCDVLHHLTFDHVGAIPYAALPIGTAVSLIGDYPLLYARKETKTYGTKASIEGVYTAGDTVVVLDDLVTTGESKFEAIEKFTDAGLLVQDVVVLIDRGQGAAAKLAQAGYQLHAVVTLPALLDIWQADHTISVAQAEQVYAWLATQD